MQFKTAASLPLPLLTAWMQHLLQAELRLKGSPIAAATILQHLLISMHSCYLQNATESPNRPCKN
jgi:DNA polymerase-3 subunit delta